MTCPAAALAASPTSPRAKDYAGRGLESSWDQVLEAGPGCYVIKSCNIPHTFWNVGPEPARLIEIIAPSGFERFFDELGDLAATSAQRVPTGRVEPGARYDQDSFRVGQRNSRRPTL